MNISHLSNEITNCLLSADRPEVKLMQIYQSSSEDQRLVFLAAIVGKVIEQDRIIKHRKGG
ncbi:hypothetical protein [Rosenbergiella collisarenosi]|uniref:hypothetical protein n=1 Tax=Rosenbergiella collisarenosi TaxID=1544695 RepID=UPI001FD1E1B1|nr:hypothetical protein [Rosenbergiella collisarenosi]